ncbi:MAG: hypothetical protein U1E22_04555, partial [Coriobacteriia bacterium]|nr:hypothetical protein [Coriobacteriia bacterium]
MDDQGTMPPAGNDQHVPETVLHPTAPPQGYPVAAMPSGGYVPPASQAAYGPPAVPPARAKSSSGWKIFAAIVAIMFLGAIACCGLSV